METTTPHETMALSWHDLAVKGLNCECKFYKNTTPIAFIKILMYIVGVVIFLRLAIVLANGLATWISRIG